MSDGRDGSVEDLIFIAILVAFFALALAFIKACERIIGPDVEATRIEQDAPSSDSQVAA
jgi:hypothetical protein